MENCCGGVGGKSAKNLISIFWRVEAIDGEIKKGGGNIV